MQVQREPRAQVLHDNGSMRVKHSLRLAGCAAREVQQRAIFTRSAGRGRLRALSIEERTQIDGVRWQLERGRGAHEQHVTQRRQLGADRCDLAAIDDIRRDEHAHVADLQARFEGLGPECGEQRAIDAAGVERAERCAIELGQAPHERGDHLTAPDAQRTERIRETTHLGRQLPEGDLAHGKIDADDAQGHAIRPRAARVTPHRNISHVEGAAGTGVELAPRREPIERAC